MIKKITTILIILLVLVTFVFSTNYLSDKRKGQYINYQTDTTLIRSFVIKTQATGRVLPLEEVLIKPNISGIVEETYVKGGDQVRVDDIIAKIRVIPNLSDLNEAKNAIDQAKINLDDQQRILERQSILFNKGVVSKVDLERSQVEYDQSKQIYKSANSRYDIVKTGTTSGYGNSANTLIRSTVSGMVLDIPIEKGSQVIQSNNFNEGSTIATIADMNRMIFEGEVEESDIGRIKENLPMEISIGAIENQVFKAKLEYVSPKGKIENGATKFEVRGTLEMKDTIFLRAGLSANASIIIERADSVLAIRKNLIQFSPESEDPYVEVVDENNKLEIRKLELGMENDIYVEIKSGINHGDKIRVFNKVARKRP